MSRFVQADGGGVDVGGGGGTAEDAFTVTLANVVIAVREVSRLTTARPTCTVTPISIVSLPTTFHDEPSAETYEVNN